MTDDTRRRPVISIGGAPSSGTTLLADLLDSVPGLACDPELGFLSVEEAYSWSEAFVRNAARGESFPSVSPYSAPRPFFNMKYLDLVGLDEHGLASMIKQSQHLGDFVDRYRRHRESIRDRSIDVLAEKTPVNVAMAQCFLDTFPEGRFVHVVRDPRHVVGSLLHRGFGLAEATVIWSQQVTHGVRLINHPRVDTVQYAELLSDPFDVAARIAMSVGVVADPKVVRDNFQHNEFRAALPRVKSWRVPSFVGSVAVHDQDRLTEMQRGWVERQSIWSADPEDGLRFVSSVGQLAHLLGFPARVVPKAKFDASRLRAIFTQFAAAVGDHRRDFAVTDPKYVADFPDRLTKASMNDWRRFLDAARPWIGVETLEQIAMQAYERHRHMSQSDNDLQEEP